MQSQSDMTDRINRLSSMVHLTMSLTALFAVTSALLLVPACSSIRSTSTTDVDHVLRVRGLIIVDEHGRDRIALGAPWPEMKGRKSNAAGVGLLITDSTGVDRVNVAAPAPDPPGVGQRIAPANGLTFYDQTGNERGGVGYLDNGRSLLVLDNEDGEGAGVFAFEGGFVGIGILSQGEFRALASFDPTEKETGLIMNDSLGQPRIRFVVPANGQASIDVLDENGNVIDSN